MELQRLGSELGLGALWVKRDDLSGQRCGGNKVRKLELLLAEARDLGSRSLVSVGGIGSSHLIATACYGRQLGLRTHGVIFPQPLTPAVEKTLLALRGLEVELWPCPNRLQVPMAMRRARRNADRPYVIGPGGSSPLGCLGFVSAGLELGEQVRSGELPEPEIIVVALGSGGTAAGLALGLELAGMRSRLWAVRVVERPLCNSVLLAWLVRRTARRLEQLDIPVSARSALRRLTLVHGQAGPRYGEPTRAALAAVERGAEEGLKLETTYTGKALAALLAGAETARSRRVLFWNTYNSRDLSTFEEAGASRPLPAPMSRWVKRD